MLKRQPDPSRPAWGFSNFIQFNFLFNTFTQGLQSQDPDFTTATQRLKELYTHLFLPHWGSLSFLFIFKVSFSNSKLFRMNLSNLHFIFKWQQLLYQNTSSITACSYCKYYLTKSNLYCENIQIESANFIPFSPESFEVNVSHTRD